MAIKKIISGGQTGSEKAALDTAIKLGLPHGGWIPKGRLTENGNLPERYQVQEIVTDDYFESYKKNVADSDGTLILFQTYLIDGPKITQELAKGYNKPYIEIDLNDMLPFKIIIEIANWIYEKHIEILNVSGPPASKAPSIYLKTCDLLVSILQLDNANSNRIDSFEKKTTRIPQFEKAFPPRTVEEAVERLLAPLTFREKTRYANLREDKLDKLYDAFFMQIRTEFRILGNDPLLASCRNIAGEEKIYPDVASKIIVKELWKRLQKENILRVLKPSD